MEAIKVNGNSLKQFWRARRIQQLRQTWQRRIGMEERQEKNKIVYPCSIKRGRKGKRDRKQKKERKWKTETANKESRKKEKKNNTSKNPEKTAFGGGHWQVFLGHLLRWSRKSCFCLTLKVFGCDTDVEVGLSSAQSSREQCFSGPRLIQTHFRKTEADIWKSVRRFCQNANW